MQISEHLALLGSEGERLAAVAATTPMDAAVPGCPGWDVEALLRHVGDVHRWAATVVRDRVPARIRADFPGPTSHDALLDWYREGHAQLLAALRATTPADVFWTWGPAPSPLAFWARRQAHETAIHRLDVQQAAGLPASFDAIAGADGVDEWLTLAARAYRHSVHDGGNRLLHLRATDSPAHWLVRLSMEGVDVGTDGTDADCEVVATGGELFALIMNRRESAGLDVSGDTDVLRAWRESVRF